ncbi:MAG: hypothetical protein WC626_07590 [Methanoregula sp.]
MEIDIRTLAIVLAIVADIQEIAFFFQYLINKTYRGVGWGFIGSSLAAFVYVLLKAAMEILSITGITTHENSEPGKGVRFEISVLKEIWRSTGNDA